MVKSKVNNIVDRIKEDRVEEFYFKNAVPDGYRLKLIKEDAIHSNIYVTSEEASDLLKQLHIKTDSLLFKVFKYDPYKELTVKKIIHYVHELGLVKAKFSSVNATKEDLINAIVHLGRITKDKTLTEIDFQKIQQEELYNILHNKHLEYLAKYEDVLLTEVNSSGS